MLELWGGHECTINRVGDTYRDQSEETGHDAHWREDLERFAALNLRALRYPVLWEKVAPDAADARDWGQADERLTEIQRLGIRPIVGLLHHGSGPRYTNLLADDFAPLFAAYARAAAERYPWVRDWTPVNEPLTTARFSALYGHWYPHAKDEGLFWRALLNEIDGVRLAMAEIRKVNPQARLIQTEDLGQVFSTPGLAAEAEAQNARRWSSWDLLTGRMTRDHPLFERISAFGLADRLEAIAEAPCPPDVIGVNYYPTSVRFLDERYERYPEWEVGPDTPADVDAVRILSPQPVDLRDLLRQTWARYAIPIAVTESHNGCTRDEQMRWTFEAWRHALDLRAEGVEVCAITPWALLGNYDWSSLITRKAGVYEAGTFDIRGPGVRATGMVDMLTRLGAGESAEAVALAHPVLLNRGWWRRDIRLTRPPYSCDPRDVHVPDPDVLQGPPLLILGGSGLLGSALVAACALRAIPCIQPGRNVLDLQHPDGFADALDRLRPWAVIDAAGWTDRDEAEAHAACMAANTRSAAALARACQSRGTPCVSLSCDPVLDEASTAQAERLIAKTEPGQRIAPAAHIISPSQAPDLANALLDLVIDGETGLHHIVSRLDPKASPADQGSPAERLHSPRPDEADRKPLNA